MRTAITRLSLVLLTGLAHALGDSLKGAADTVATYDSILAGVSSEQSMVALGDMTVPVDTVRLWRDQLAGTAGTNSASKTGINKWTGGNVYFAFNANVSAAHQAAFLDGVREWEAFANIHFVARTSETNYIMVNDGGPGLSGGNSAVGMIGGVQQLNIGSASWNRGTIMHETGHALGLIHEHQRSDRDTFVTINFSNVPGGASDGNFILIPASTNNGAYDFLSVMHYARKALAVNPALDTISPKPGFTQFIDVMGNNPDRVLSRGDRDGIAIMYGAGPAISTVVTNTRDSGVGSLRTAIYRAFDIVTDTPASTPTISFQIPNTDPNFSGGVFTIRPTDRLPAPGPSTTIDGATQTTFGGDTNASGPEIEINGSLQNDPSTYGLGLRLSAANVTVKGLVINGFSTQGILITGTSATGNTVSGCYIGTNAAGTAAVANSFAGIEIKDGATNNTIGGTTATARNVISGNSAQGVLIRGTGTSGNVVRGNYVGINAAGTGAVANAFSGVEIGIGATNDTVGGSVAGAGNVLSGNAGQGVYVTGSNNHVIAGNLIGTNAAGTAAVANGGAGVEIVNGATGNTVGGTTAAARNVLAGNTYQGVALNGTGTTNNVVAGNYVGLNAAGTAAIPNVYGGIAIFGGAANNMIGGSVTGSGNVISGNSAQGVVITNTGSSGNVIAGNRIGTNPAGTAAIPNSYSGVGIFTSASGNIIGGGSPGAGNQISGNNNQGIYIGDFGSNGNLVQGNYIGTNSDGTGPLANGYAGVELGGQAQNNVVGGTVPGLRNVISGNLNQGVLISTSSTMGNRVEGNYIGTNAAGTAPVANGYPGVEIVGGANGNFIGGAAPGAGNVISGNSFRGVTLASSGTTANTIAGNLIGLNRDGTAALPNDGPGIQIFNGAHDNTIGGLSGGRNFIAGNNGAGLTLSGGGTSGSLIVGNSIGTAPSGLATANANEGIALFADITGGPTGTVIGGSTPGAANFISGNATAGIAIYNTGTTGNRISGNSIAGNGGLGIDIWGDGSTANDEGDGDTGPNNLQNFPVLTSAVLGTATTVAGTLNSAASTTFRIEFFEGTTADASGFGEGLNFIGAIDAATNGSGNATINQALPAIVPAGHFICATATDPAGNTSEFSHNVTVTATDTDGDGLPNAYETANGLSTSVADANTDTDGDGMTNAQEFRAQTDPRSSSSVLRLAAPAFLSGDAAISIPTILGVTYRVERADDLMPSTAWRTLADQIAGSGSTIIITDPGAASLSRRFYRATVVP